MFYRDKGKKEGHNYRCADCARKRASEYRKNHPLRTKAATDKYYKDPAKRYKLGNWTRENPEMTKNYQRNHRLKKYGLTTKDYEAIYELQGGVCGICGLPETSSSHGGEPNSLSIDHCHETDKIRGLLCNRCNKGIGNFKDDIDILASAISYLGQPDLLINKKTA